MPTFSQILNSMITYLQGLGSKITDFTATSVVYQIFSAIASVIDQIYFSIANAQNQAYINTATGTGLDNKGADVGVPRKQATAAQWYFTFGKSQVSSNAYTIPAGTVITTIPSTGQSPITFTTNAVATLPAGTSSVTVLSTCTTAGSIGNIAVGTQLLIGSATPGIDTVSLVSLTSPSAGTYGTDIETDTAYRSRLLSAYNSKAQGTVAWYQATALGVTGVSAVKVNPQGRGSGTVDIYIVGTNNALPSTTLINSTQSAIDASRIITDDAKVFAPTADLVTATYTIKVASGYDLTATANAVQTAIINYITNLGIGGGTAGELYQSQAVTVANGVAGVLNTTTTGTDTAFSAFQLPQATTSSITVTSSY